MIKIFILICFILKIGFLQAQSPIKIIQDGKVGYINQKGEIAIPPVFLNGYDFSDGLAAVRKDGLYGFIDKKGKWAIEPQYDYADNFIKGLTIVYKNEKPVFINKKGERILPPVYNSLFFVDNKRAVISTIHSRKRGVLDIKSKILLVDTTFNYISSFQNGVALVRKNHPFIENKVQYGVIDKQGKYIVPFNKYELIRHYSGGFAIVKRKDSTNIYGEKYGVINTKGNLLFEIPDEISISSENDFFDGYLKIRLENSEAYINSKGKIVPNDAVYEEVTDFKNGRAFVMKKDEDNYILIDKKFKHIGHEVFEEVQRDFFRNNYAIVKSNDVWGIIDRNGEYIVKPKYKEIDEIGVIANKYFFFIEENDNGDKKYGMVNLKGEEIIKPIMQDFDKAGFLNGILRLLIDDKVTCINEKGKIIWQEKKNPLKPKKPLNIDFMHSGYFYASSSIRKGRYGWLGNTPQKISGNIFAQNTLSVVIDTAQIDTFKNDFIGYKVFVSNTTKDTIEFDTQGNRLYMKLQAQNKKGEWQDIEYLPPSFCGMKYYDTQLEPNAFWSFTMPKYEGLFKTKIRVELEYFDATNSREKKIIYSNSINGSINITQFWRNRRWYYSSGFTEPYND
ncbi:MAG: WG repeat-containing protein [Raineya sp.]|nr:WG repeat-containing protein [Raineya sp.]